MPIQIYDIPNKFEVLFVCGDIHGEFPTLIYELKRHVIRDAVVVLAGDCGIGFEKPSHYDQLYQKLRLKLESLNVLLLLMRGNHDDPSYFEKRLIDFPLIKTIPDYSVIKFHDHNILCIGGAISVDREMRKEQMRRDRLKKRGSFRTLYWENEPVVFDEEKLSSLIGLGSIYTVITHTSPSFCYPLSKVGITELFSIDDFLERDLLAERQLMDKIYNTLKSDGHPVTQWFYGHFHDSHTEFISDTKFSLLNINELKNLYG